MLSDCSSSRYEKMNYSFCAFKVCNESLKFRFGSLADQIPDHSNGPLCPSKLTFILRRSALIINTQSLPCSDNSSLNIGAVDFARNPKDSYIRFGRPSIPAYRIKHVASPAMALYAARSYLRENGIPACREDMAGHHCVTFSEDRIPGGLVWDTWADLIRASKGISYASNSPHAVALAINQGFGIGILPRYAAQFHANLEELPIETGPPLELYVVTHEETGQSLRVRETLNYIYMLFETERYRFFGS